MPGNNVEEILRTLEYIRGLTEQGRKEMAHMWNYIGTFGFYIFLGSFAGAIFNEWRIWIWALPFAFLFSTGPSLGWTKSLVTWAVASGLVVLLASVLTEPLLVIFAVVVLAALGFSVLYGTASKEERRKRSFTVAPRLGVFWGIIMSGVAVNIFSLAKVSGMNMAAINSLLWPFATGVGYLITGFFTSREFVILGLLAIFGVPVIYAVVPELTFLFYGLIGLLIGIFAIRLRLTRERSEEEVQLT